MFGIGAGEFIIILIVGLIVFGPSKLPEVGRAIGKGLREFRKAQAALSQTLNEVDDPPKTSPPVKPLTTESFASNKPATDVQPTTQPVEEKTSPPQVTADELIKSVKENPLATSSTADKPSQATADKPSQVTVDDVIKSAKENPLVKENQHEKIFDGNPVDAANYAACSSSAGARGGANGVDKQP